MKLKNKQVISIAIIGLIILIGIILVGVVGFNKELRFEQSQSIDIYIEQEYEISKVKEIANEVLGKKNIVQTVEIYKDMVTIRAESISEEQKNDIVNKIKENYDIKQIAEDTVVNSIPATRILDLYKKYVTPFIIAEVLVIVYMVIRYYKNGILKVLLQTVIIPVVSELLLFSIIAITRLPIGTITPILAIAIYIITILYVTNKNEKKV